MFSMKERERRLDGAARAIGEAGLRAVYLPGNGTVGPNSFGCHRYFTDSRTTFFLKSVVLFNGAEPAAVADSLLGKLNLVQNSFIKDVEVNPDQLGGVIEILKSRGIDSGRVGTLFEVLPASWLIRLRDALPGVEFVDFSEELFALRTVKSGEEIETQRICAGIADAGYRTVCEILRPGMYENEVVAEMDRAMQRMGAEESFALITSGSFSAADNRLPPLHNYSSSNRRIEKGDVVALEITPRYGGYWTQLVRTVCVGEPNGDTDAFRKIIVGAIDAAKTVLRAKTPIAEVAGKMREYTEAAGYRFVMPCGHIAGVDLDEEGVTENSARLLEPGMLIIVHPTVITGDMQTSIFWGESYIITENGFESPMKSGSGLITTAL